MIEHWSSSARRHIVLSTASLAVFMLCGAESAWAQTDGTVTPAAVAAPQGGSGQRRFTASALADRPWFDPAIADPRAPQIAALALAFSDEFQYMVNSGSRRIWDISLGKEIPIVVFETNPGRDGEIVKGGWGWGIWTPVNFHMVSDFKDDSSPIINTDYRFAGMAKVAYGLSETTNLAWKVQFGHESTHLGDEFTIHAEQTYGAAFERINVSYEYLEYGMLYEREGLGNVNDPDATLWTLGIRGGFMHTIDRGHPGFYSLHLLDDSRTLEPSKRNHEPSFGVELIPTGSKGWIGGWTPFVSVDGRWKTVYDYHKTSAEQDEDVAFSLSVATGLRNVTATGRGKADIMIKFYRGLNPNGQFRSQADYWMVGAGVRVRV